jgi:hypothetical protein
MFRIDLRNVSRVIARIFARFESLGTDAARDLSVNASERSGDNGINSHVTNAVTREHERSSDLLLRESRDVGADHRQAHAEAQTLEVAEPQSDKTAPFLIIRQAHEESGADDADEVCDDHGGAARVGPFAADEAAAEEGGELDETTGDLEVLCTESVEAETADDQGCELKLTLAKKHAESGSLSIKM